MGKRYSEAFIEQALIKVYSRKKRADDTVGRRFKNDTERLEKLFELYTKMTAVTATRV